ncbi:PorV/PorQ family protein [bacterium]|nr:PorV/PorQ family protein [bacterium]
MTTTVRTLATALLAVVLLAGLIAPEPVFAQNKVGTTAAPFLTIGIGTRPQAMGGAFVAVADDANALYWNPAGLGNLNQMEMLLVHSTWLADMNFEYIGAVFPMGAAGTVGLSTTLLNVGEMEQTTVLQQDGTGLFFNSYDLAIAGHYAYRFYDKFSIGGTVKYVHQKIWNEKASGYAFDIGTLFVTPFKDMRLGMNISNFGSKMQMSGKDLLVYHDPDASREGNNELVTAEYETDQWKLPLTLRLGVSGEFIQTQSHRLTYAADWVVPNDNTESYNVGMEYGFQEMYFLRAGLRSMRPGTYDEEFNLFEPDNGGGFTFGGGLVFNISGMFGLGVDYAFESFDRLGNVHKYSLNLKF